MRKLIILFALATCSFFLVNSELQAQATVNCPANITVNAATGQCGRNVSYSAPTATCAGGGTQAVNFNYTGSVQNWTVPSGVTSINIKCWGAQGRTSVQANAIGGRGGYATGNRAVTGGTLVRVYIGGGGGVSPAAGYNGGGNAGSEPCAGARGGGGGGASDVRIGGAGLGNRVIVGGGGGGGGGRRIQGCGRGSGGGGGGGRYGGGGGAAWPGIPPGGSVPTGGTQTAGGAGGNSTWTAVPGNDGSPGGLGTGGKGGNEISSSQSGSATAQPGGYGGGTVGQNGLYNASNNWTGQSGAGGSGYIGGVTAGSMSSNQRSGNGLVTITYTVNYTPTVSQTAGSSSGAFFPVGTTTNTYNASCPVGSPSSCSFTVTVVDNQNPTATCPSNMTVNTASGQCSANVTYSVTSADNCPGQTLSQSAGSPSGSSFPVGSTTNTFIATDGTGKTATCSFAITVVDNQNPSVSCPANISINAPSGQCTAPATFSVSSSDNCPGQTLNQIAGMPSGGSFPIGTTTNTFVATDASSNTASCGFTVTVVDNQNPTITCPAPITVNNDAGNCTALVNYSLTAADNCPGESTNQTAGLASGSLFPIGTTTNTFVVSDASSNTATCSFSVTVVDNEQPTITCPSNQTLNNDNGNCSAVATFSIASADNCTGQTVSQTAGLASGAAFPVGTTSNTFVVTDAASNTATCSFSVTVVDAENPVLNCPSNITTPGSSNNCSPSVTWPTVSITDNCAVSTQSSTHTSGSNFTPGTTTVTYTAADAAGNSNTCSFTVTVTTSPLSLSLSNSTFLCGTNLSCNGDASGSVTANVTGGCEPYVYSWSSGGTNATISGLAAGNYTVVVTDNLNNTITDSVTLTEPSPLTTAITASPGVCGPLGATGTVDLTVGGGATCQAYTYAWTGPGTFSSTTEDLNSLGYGTYVVTVTDTNGCSMVDSVTIALYPLPIPDLGPDSTLCNGNVMTLDPGSFSSYLWFNNSTAATLPVSTAGSYWAEVTDANGCQDRDTIEVMIYTVPATSHSYNEPMPLCQNDTATLTASGGYTSYSWAAGSNVISTVLTNDNVDVISPGGDVYLTVSDLTGCSRTDTITVPFLNVPDPNPVISPSPGILCPGETDTLDAGAGFASYLWNTGLINQTLVVGIAGTYSVTVTNAGGCGEIDSVSVINVPAPTPVVTFVNDTLLTQQGYAAYQWSVNGTPLTGATNYLYVPPVTGQYSVTVTDSNGCMGIGKLDIIIGIDDARALSGLEIFPNPTNGVLHIRPFTPIDRDVSIRVVDMFGKIVMSEKLDNLVSDKTLDMSRLAKGVYVVTLATENAKFSKRIIKD